jgi:ribosomal-protein-alanine N-acetyltransferase
MRSLKSTDISRLHERDRICFDAEVAYTRAELIFYLKHPDAITKVVELGGGIVAFAVARITDDMWAQVITLDVLPEARRRGIGTSLMRALHQELQRRNVAVSVLEVEVDNGGALEFYRRLGYETVEKLRGYYLGRRDAYRMVTFVQSPTG